MGPCSMPARLLNIHEVSLANLFVQVAHSHHISACVLALMRGDRGELTSNAQRWAEFKSTACHRDMSFVFIPRMQARNFEFYVP